MKNQNDLSSEIKKITRFFQRGGSRYILLVLDDERMREYLIVTVQTGLKKSKKEIANLELNHKGDDLSIYNQVKKFLDHTQCDGLIITNMNALIYRDSLRTVDLLNKSRDAFERFGLPMAFLVNTANLKRIIQGAPDFYQLRELPDFHIEGTGIWDPVLSDFPGREYTGLSNIGLKAELLEEHLKIAEEKGEIDEDILNSLVIPLLKIYIDMSLYTKMKTLFSQYIEGREGAIKDKQALADYCLKIGEIRVFSSHRGVPKKYFSSTKSLAIEAIEARRRFFEAGEWDRAAEITFDLEDYLTLNGNPRESFDLLKELEDKDINDKNRSILLHRLGLLHQGFGNYDEALKQFQKAKEIFERMGDIRGISISLHNIGIIYDAKGDYDEAIKQHQRAMEIREKIGVIVGVANSSALIGDAHFKKKEYEAALKFFVKAFVIFANAGSPNTEKIAQDIARVREKLPEERFVEIFKEFGITPPGKD